MIDLPRFVLYTVTLAVLVIVIVALRIRRSRQDAVVLHLVRRDGPVSSLRVAMLLGLWVYPVLRRLERRGILASHEEPGGPGRGGRPRRIYDIVQRVQPLTPLPRA